MKRYLLLAIVLLTATTAWSKDPPKGSQPKIAPIARDEIAKTLRLWTPDKYDSIAIKTVSEPYEYGGDGDRYVLVKFNAKTIGPSPVLVEFFVMMKIIRDGTAHPESGRFFSEKQKADFAQSNWKELTGKGNPVLHKSTVGKSSDFDDYDGQSTDLEKGNQQPGGAPF